MHIIIIIIISPGWTWRSTVSWFNLLLLKMYHSCNASISASSSRFCILQEPLRIRARSLATMIAPVGMLSILYVLRSITNWCRRGLDLALKSWVYVSPPCCIPCFSMNMLETLPFHSSAKLFPVYMESYRFHSVPFMP